MIEPDDATLCIFFVLTIHDAVSVKFMGVLLLLNHLFMRSTYISSSRQIYRLQAAITYIHMAFGPAPIGISIDYLLPYAHEHCLYRDWFLKFIKVIVATMWWWWWLPDDEPNDNYLWLLRGVIHAVTLWFRCFLLARCAVNIIDGTAIVFRHLCGCAGPVKLCLLHCESSTSIHYYELIICNWIFSAVHVFDVHENR